MSAAKKIIDRVKNNVVGRWDRAFDLAYRYQLPSFDIGTSKEYGLLDYRSYLNDIDFWRSMAPYINTKPETGGEQIYGREKTYLEPRKFINILGIKIPTGYDDVDAEVLHGPTTRELNVRNGSAREAVDSKVRDNDIRDLQRKNVFGKVKTGIVADQDLLLKRPLGSKGVSLETDTNIHFTHDFQESTVRVAQTFDTEERQYVKRSSVLPNWIEQTEENPSLDKSKLRINRNTEQVRVMSDWTGDEPSKTYLEDNKAGYEFRSDFKRETTPKIKIRKTGTQVPRVNPFSTETSLPRDEMAILFYQKVLKKYGYPGGQQVNSLEYNKEYEEALGLIPFCITTITPDHRTYLNFMATLESYNDNYTGDWDSVQYVGRAEKFYGYTGFSRSIDISFKIAIFRKEDCEEMYHRLNRLVGATAPSYDETGLFMRGTLASLTIGDLLKHKAGIVNSVRISWQTDYPWEVRASERSRIPAGEFMVPHVLDVSLQFTPIEEKVVTEDNGDYFVFRHNKPFTPVRGTTGGDAVKSPSGPSTEQHTVFKTPEMPEYRVGSDHTPVVYNPLPSADVNGGGGGTNGRRIPLPNREITGVTGIEDELDIKPVPNVEAPQPGIISNRDNNGNYTYTIVNYGQ